MFYWILTSFDLRYDLSIDLPHASLTSQPQNRVSVIISCKTCKSESVENVRTFPAPRSDEEPTTEAACRVVGGGI